MSYANAQVFLDENFDSGIPAGWTITDGGTSADTWFETSGGYSGSYLDDTEFAFVDSDAAGSGVDLDEILESPAVNTTGYSNYYLEFDHYFNSYLGDETAEVEIFDGADWQTVATFSDSDAGAWGTPDHQIIDITAYSNANLKVRFHYTANYDYYWAIDNVKISGNSVASCDAITTFPWSENFDGETIPDMPACWAIEDNSAPDDDWMTSTTNPSSSPNCIFISWDSSNPLDDWAFSPGFSLTSGTSYNVEFVYRAYSSSYSESLKLYYGTSQSSGGMTVELFDDASFNHTTYETVSVDFTPGSSGTYYFGWHAYSAANLYGIHVDDITVSLSPSCAAPSNLSASSITANQAELSWTDNAGTSTFDIELGAAGFTPSETPTKTSVSNNYTYDELSPDTDYDYYVRADCGGGEYSVWVGPFEFTTALPNMEYTSSTVTQGNTDVLGINSSNQEIICIEVLTTNSSNPLNVTQFNLNTNGSTNAGSDVLNAKLYYTSTTGTFGTATQFGETVTNPDGNFTIIGTQALAEGTNYFWLAYDITSSATLGNVVDAQCSSITVDASEQIPTVTNPVGERQIDYCTSIFTNTSGDWITNVSFNTINNTTGQDGASSYGDYTGISTNVDIGSSYNLSVSFESGTFTQHVWAWIDWNQDGDFDDAGEAFDLGDGESATLTTNITIPATALTGDTRMRVSEQWNVDPVSCESGSYGETEDYTINVQGSAPKSLSGINYLQASTEDVNSGNSDEEILRLDFNVTGSSGTLNLNTIEVTSNNTSDADIATNGVKLYRTSTTSFATDNLLGSAQSFSSGSATFSPLNYDLPTGTTYIWVVYDIDASATVNNSVDAMIEANKIDVAGSTYPASTENPAGSRAISMANGGTDCADPYVINSLPFSNTGMTTDGFGNDYNDTDACGSYYMNGDDFVFEYTPSTNECINITLSNTDIWTGLFVTDGCPDVGTCLADNTNSAGNPALSNLQLTASNTYYFTVSTWPSPQFTAFDIDIQSVPCSGSGVDDVWPGLDLGTLTCPSTNVYSENTTGAIDDCAHIIGADHIYNFTISDQADVSINTCGSAYDTKLFVYELVGGDCATANYIAFNDDDCSLQSSVTLNALAAGDYVIVVEGYLGAEGAYDLTIDLTNCGGDCPDCNNGIRDCQETGVDCGGPDCPPCEGWEHPTVGIQGTYNGGCMIPTCGGNYYDDGGSAGNYSNDVDLIYRTFCPEQPNKCLKATFNSLDIDEVSIDDLLVLNGPTQNSDILWWGYGNKADFSITTLEGNWNNGEIISTHDSGCLTFRFSSDETGQAEGWEVSFDCVDCSGPSGVESNDCENSISVCNNFDFSGSSTGPGLSNDGCSGCVTSETYSNWYQIEIMSSGTLGLTIDPVTNSDDYDFALYQSYDCDNLGSPVRCSFAANYSAHCFNGIMDEDETGVDTGGADCPAVASDGNTGMMDGAGDTSEDVSGDMWVEDINVTEGETYFLLINNWSPDGDGFDLTWDLSNGASLGVQPKIESAINASNNTFEVEISEPINCSSVSSDGSDFVLECTGSTTEAECLANSIIAASPMNCANDSTSWIEITLANSLPEAKASYENDWKIRCSGTNSVVDVCNNPLNGGEPDILLPVEFLFVNGICHNEFVEILWTTASEINNEYFTLQRSDDGRHFIDLTTVLGAGNSSIANDYLWIDDEPLNGTAYYRIKQTDFDGRSSFSEMFSVFCQTEIGNLSISPNPCGDYMNIEFSLQTKQVHRLKIYSTLGDPVMSFQIPEDTQRFKMTGLDKLTPGMYILEIATGNFNRFYRFVKM